jgi:chemotaxis family two-component system response regulator Rcp1
LSVARDGLEALAFLRHQGIHSDVPRPDLILLDLNLPKKGGREVLAEIKMDPDLKHIPVVVFTSSAAPLDISQSYVLRANCYVTKPADLDELFHAIASIEKFWLNVVRLPKRGRGSSARVAAR